MDAYDSNLVYWIWLSQINGIGPVIAKILLNVFENPQNIYKATKFELIDIKGIGSVTADTIFNSKSLVESEEILKKCGKLNIHVLTYGDSLYPFEVKGIKKAPVILYYRGNIIEDSMGIAIVGSRRCTDYGKRLTVEAGEFLAENNISVISGMAKGVDGYAHTACLKANGYTIAILGCGLDICYPKEHVELMQRIIEKGAVISEYPPGTKPDAKHFPMRNRLISAWCKKLLVVEAGEKSGSLLTAAYAKEQNRQVFAAPNSIYSGESLGTNKLIDKGAKIYLNPSQLLLDPMRKPRVNNKIQNSESIGDDLTSLEKAILMKIEDNPMTLGELLLHLKKNKSDILETISIMELKGRIINVGGFLKKQ
ncbi:DNA-processing protein DprA [Clostridium algoriphilum]|uniref:DNA-processing protein DprA n=1 Tax=Clostridium algoriphilum TaxID=198347 RepID=UPI001CF4FFC0|nr:DNA-processing protein DprA [Clostridium algoriphilum]MCB2293917.1 DNA-processing protein DprA [Clostridium algoriphilum]